MSQDRDSYDHDDEDRDSCEECGMLDLLNSAGLCPSCAEELGFHD